MPSPDLSRIIYGLPEAVLLVEPEGSIVAANPGAGRLFQQPYAELVGRRLESVVTEDSTRITRFLRLCLRNAEGVPGGFHLRVAGQVMPCRAVGGLVHHREQQGQLVWLRLPPRQTANSRFIAYNERLRAAVRELKARELSEKRWRAAFEDSSIGIAVCDLDGRFLAANPAYQAMVGYSEEELQGLSFLSLTYEQDRDVTDQLVRELLQHRQQHYQVEKRYRRKNGSLLWVRVNASLVSGGESMPAFLFAVVEDITQRKRAEDALRGSEKQMRTFFDNSPSLIFIKDTDGRYVFVNKEFEKTLKVAEEQIKGKRDEDVFPVEQAAAFCANDLQVLHTGLPMEFEEVALQEDGPHTSIVQKFPLFDSEGRIYATGGIATDITQRKQAEKALQHSEHQHRTVVETATDAVVAVHQDWPTLQKKGVVV
jgi:PAS domain S-box-containing protein